MNLPFPDNQNFEAQNNVVPIPLLANHLRIPIEHAVSEYIGKQWTVKQFRDMNDFSSHPSAIFSDESYSVFVKFSQAQTDLNNSRPNWQACDCYPNFQES